MNSFRITNQIIDIFGESHIEETAKSYNIPLWVSAPIDPKIAAAADGGKIEFIGADWLSPIAEGIEK